MTWRKAIWSFPLLVVLVALSTFALWGRVQTTAPSLKSWNATWVGNATIIGNCDNGALSFVESGVGFLEEAGMSKWSDKYCMDPTTWTARGRKALITAENGDKIFMKIELLFIWNATKTGGNWVEHETIIGGTGSYASAIGGSHSKGTFTLTDQTHAEWEGTGVGLISY
jgi:hypothetical protein